MTPAADADGLVEAFEAWFEAEREYLEARFYAQYADEIAEHGLPDHIEVPDLDAATAALAERCTAEMLAGYRADRVPRMALIADEETGPDDLYAPRPLLMVQRLEDAAGRPLAAAIAGGLYAIEARVFESAFFARPDGDGWRVVAAHDFADGALEDGAPLLAGGWPHACGEALEVGRVLQTTRIRAPLPAAQRAAFFVEPNPAFADAERARIEDAVLAIAQGEPGTGPWFELRRHMMALAPNALRPTWRDAVLAALDRWPDEMAWVQGHDPHHPAWPLTRALHIEVGGEPLDDAVFADLRRLPALRTLRLVDATPADVQRVSRVPGPTRLELHGPGTTVSDLGPLAAHPTLDTLGLRWCPALDLTPGWLPPNIRRVEADNLKLDDLSPFAGAGHLRSLKVTASALYMALGGIGAVDGLEHLEELDLSYSSVPTLEGIEHLVGLRRLNLMSTAISDIRAIAGLTGLIWLNLAGCDRLGDIAPVAKLTALRSLNLSGSTTIADLSPAAACPHLAWLAVRAPALRALDPIAEMTALETLGLVQCPLLTSADIVRGLPRLRRVTLSSCENLRDIEALGALPHVFVEGSAHVPTVKRGSRWDPPG